MTSRHARRGRRPPEAAAGPGDHLGGDLAAQASMPHRPAGTAVVPRTQPGARRRGGEADDRGERRRSRRACAVRLPATVPIETDVTCPAGTHGAAAVGSPMPRTREARGRHSFAKEILHESALIGTWCRAPGGWWRCVWRWHLAAGDALPGDRDVHVLRRWQPWSACRIWKCRSRPTRAFRSAGDRIRGPPAARCRIPASQFVSARRAASRIRSMTTGQPMPVKWRGRAAGSESRARPGLLLLQLCQQVSGVGTRGEHRLVRQHLLQDLLRRSRSRGRRAVWPRSQAPSLVSALLCVIWARIFSASSRRPSLRVDPRQRGETR